MKTTEEIKKLARVQLAATNALLLTEDNLDAIANLVLQRDGWIAALNILENLAEHQIIR
jgi:hypothetical protein